MNIRTILPQTIGLLALSFMTGCVGPRYPLSIGNANPRLPVRDVMVSADESKLGSFDEIAPNNVTKAKSLARNFPHSIIVTWIDPEGTRYTDEVAISNKIHEGFRGQVVVEISPANTLSLKLIGASAEEESSLPLLPPEDWEGSITLPGME